MSEKQSDKRGHFGPDGSRWCQHCKKSLICKPRGLCWMCYYNLDVRKLYTTRMGFYPPQPVGWNENYPIEPTSAPPGSEDKIDAMRKRAENLAPLHHPEDAGQTEKIVYGYSRQRGYSLLLPINGVQKNRRTIKFLDRENC